MAKLVLTMVLVALVVFALIAQSLAAPQGRSLGTTTYANGSATNILGGVTDSVLGAVGPASGAINNLPSVTGLAGQVTPFVSNFE